MYCELEHKKYLCQAREISFLPPEQRHTRIAMQTVASDDKTGRIGTSVRECHMNVLIVLLKSNHRMAPFDLDAMLFSGFDEETKKFLSVDAHHAKAIFLC